MRKNFKFIFKFIFKLKYKTTKIIFIIIFLILEILIYNDLFEHNSQFIKVCLCTIGKEENKYAKEYVEHYKKYGVDKIFIYDNNDINGERFENVLSNYISNKFVEIINFRGLKQAQMKMLNNCYSNYYRIYDWFIMFDMDEYINLKYYKNIKNYLNKEKFKKCQVIYFFRAFHLDNNQIYYENKTLFKRFPKTVHNVFSVKAILKGHIPNLFIYDPHILNGGIESCYGSGQKKCIKFDFKYNFIDHFYYKSTEEFMEKVLKGDIYFNNTLVVQKRKILEYFESNEITLEKIDYIEKKSGINLSEIRDKITNISPMEKQKNL